MNKYAVGDRDGKRHYIEAFGFAEIGEHLKFYGLDRDDHDVCIASFREAIYCIKLKAEEESYGS